ncbi:competence/damage-inducible protein A [Cytobacillus horneckiae]|uniref:Putative competence-damage inducible protein n=1 Tax=Cytobacillus horneckiae TaxID=549687 RepID=A0A2N0ZLW6_9BACI|nr:competence/damage-inducible protein A [Cytobacillus horneckiae]MEC1157087.1 competence/damage-inducible protein A [Cytobacillus horneckiae]MED2939887.1 competence/damage-inducible protein A [Cytobacillus horneckiae]PKG30488.1 competence/damage-inducible protein A [Cytobacillus horneckiae]
MNAEIIAVGSELLLGQIVNTNAKFLSQQLADLGINVYYHTVVGDNPQRLKTAIEAAESRADLLVFTGGLGPTKDDLTKETIARHVGAELELDMDALYSIEEYFKRTNRPMTENNKKQALILAGSKVLPNEHGMAPGMLYQGEQCKYMLLPGPPKEMEPMFLKYGHAALKANNVEEVIILSRVLRFFGIGEAMLETVIEDILDKQDNPTIAPLAGDSEVTLRLTAKHANAQTALSMLAESEKEILSRVGEYFYGYDDTSLFIELSKKLAEKNLTIAAAESLTGGLFQKEFTSIPGAGSLLKGGVVCYTNEVKANVLKVKETTIQNEGVVSSQCAAELAENTALIMNADIGISFTGVAGPDELEGHPVGTVYIGIYQRGQKASVEKLNLGGSRAAIRTRSVLYGCYFLLKQLNQS